MRQNCADQIRGNPPDPSSPWSIPTHYKLPPNYEPSSRWLKQRAARYHLDVNDERSSGIEDRADSNTSEVIVSAPRARTRARWAETVFLAALIVYASLAVLANRYAYFEWDLELARRIQSISLPGFGLLMTGVSLLGVGWYAWLLVILTGLALIKAGLRPEGVMCMAGAGTGSLANRLLKLAIGRPRPTEELVRVAGLYHHESFPSGHV